MERGTLADVREPWEKPVLHRLAMENTAAGSAFAAAEYAKFS